MKLRNLLALKFWAVAIGLFLAFSSNAQIQSSYIYIEGINGIPFKVLLNSVEKPMLGKNYSIVTSDVAGENKIEIQFSGDVYETQTFILDVLPGSSYGYKLAKAGDNRFYLMDLVNNGKIIETNSAVNIGLTTELNTIRFDQGPVPVEKKIANDTRIKEDVSSEPSIEKESRSERKKKKKELAEAEKAVNAQAKKEEQEKAKEFGVVEVIQSSDVTEKSNVEKKEEKKVVQEPVQPVAKKTCLRNASENEINSFVEKLKQKSDDEAKLILIKKKIFTGCITAMQLYQMVEVLETQYGRFSFIKFIKPEVNTPSDLILLEPLFKYDSYKQKLKKLSEE